MKATDQLTSAQPDRSTESRRPDESVGYGRPPREHQFKPGRSGNPRGRRKGTRNLLGVFKEVARQKLRVRIGGESRIVTLGEYVILANFYAARAKNQNAMDNMLKFAEQTGQFADLDKVTQPDAPIAHSTGLTAEEFEGLFGYPPEKGDPDIRP